MGVRPASHTVAVLGSPDTVAAPAQDTDPLVASDQQGSWGSWGWAGPCSLAGGSPVVGSPVVGIPEPGSPEQRGCMEGAGQGSS